MIYFFTADWCTQCQIVKSEIEKSNIGETNSIKYIDIDDDDNEDIVNEYNISKLPCISDSSKTFRYEGKTECMNYVISLNMNSDDF